MDEYISRSLLLVSLDRNIAIARAKYGGNGIVNRAINLVQLTRDFIAAQPAEDVVEVVRCKDCKHWDYYTISPDGTLFGNCECHHNDFRDEGDFCSYGKRKDGEG